MKPAFCAGIVDQLSISRKRAMKSCHPAESGTRGQNSAVAFEGLVQRKWQRVLFAPLLHPSKL
jgi:hypothetical protein